MNESITTGLEARSLFSNLMGYLKACFFLVLLLKFVKKNEVFWPHFEMVHHFQVPENMQIG